MVDEAKAFCTGCDHAFVEEERPKTTNFQKMGNTVQFGQTMYNQMLEDMGLDISKSSNRSEKRVEVIAPLDTVSVQPAKKAEKAPVPATHPRKEKIPDQPRAASNTKWYILAAFAVVLLLPLSLASATLFFLDIWSRLFH